jgi:hypothetical protein
MLPIAASLSHRRGLATIVERMRRALCLHGHLHRTHRTLWEDEKCGVHCLVIGLADETQHSANVRVFDLAELAALVGRIRGGRRHERRLPHGAEAVAVDGFDRVCRLRG